MRLGSWDCSTPRPCTITRATTDPVAHPAEFLMAGPLPAESLMACPRRQVILIRPIINRVQLVSGLSSDENSQVTTCLCGRDSYLANKITSTGTVYLITASYNTRMSYSSMILSWVYLYLRLILSIEIHILPSLRLPFALSHCVYRSLLNDI